VTPVVVPREIHGMVEGVVRGRWMEAQVMSPWRRLKDALKRVLRTRPPDRAVPMPEYERVYTSLTREELQDETEPLTEAMLIDDLFHPDHRSHRFLGFYSVHGGQLAFERYGFLQLLRDRGFDPQLSMDLSDPDLHVLRIHDTVAVPEHLLIQLVAGFRDVELPNGRACRTLFVNWLLMQDPRAQFPPDCSPLPDQDHPGLGLFLYFGHLLRLIGVRLQCDGLLNHPAHFHNGVMYGKVMQFVDPQVEGRFRALERDLRHLSLGEATWAVDNGRVRDAQGRVVDWVAADQMMPITLGAMTWFDDEMYLRTVNEERERARFEIESK
jgi:hypothetical protein